jgi:pimeloyl-ACP methyl ester carboxylesterase
MRILRWVAFLGAIAIGAGFVGADSVAVGMIVGISPAKGRPAARPADVREIVQVTRAGATVRAWVIDPVGTPRGTIVMLHGIHDSKLSLLGGARAHAQRGYRVVPVDSRGHGESTGRFLTYGVEEAKDLVAIVDRLEQRGLLARPLAVVGSSYGAATALQHAASDTRVDKVVAIAPFASLREVVPAYLHWALGGFAQLVPSGWVNHVIGKAGRSAGFDPNQACPRCVASRIRGSVLLVASRDDERIPFQECVEIHKALGPRAQLILVDGARHVDTGNAPGVPEAVNHWLDRPTLSAD